MIIKLKEYLKNKEDYTLIDIRNKADYESEHIEGSINCTIEEARDLKIDKPLFIGYERDAFDENCDYLEGGFEGYILYKAENSITRKYRRELWSKFTKAVSDYELIQENDVIAVCISGGKDSMLMAKLFMELHKHSKVPFSVHYIVMDPGYLDYNRQLIIDNARRLNIPIEIFDTRIFDTVDNLDRSPCYICARMRRGYLYNYARNIGCNKIALGHHFDDAIETTLMSMLWGGQIETMLPKLKSENFEGMELIRPLYLIREENIIKWRDYNKLRFLRCACHFTEQSETNESASKRLETRKLIKKLKETNPQVEMNIFRSMENVQLKNVLGYKLDDVYHYFLDEYED